VTSEIIDNYTYQNKGDKDPEMFSGSVLDINID
jgi:hypothetical protein